MTGRATLGFHRRVLKQERSLLISMALDTCGVGSRRLPGLLRLETAVRIVTIAAPHRSFQHLMVMGCGELRLNLGVATNAQLRIVRFHQSYGCEPRLFRVRCGWQQVRARDIAARDIRV
jgi:hypothetical protein